MTARAVRCVAVEMPRIYGEMSDERLLELTIAGDASAFEMLFVKYGPELLRLCSNRVAKRADFDADDVFQEIMMTVLQQTTRREPSESVKEYLFRVAENKCRRSRRRRREYSTAPEDMEKMGGSHLDSPGGPEHREVLSRTMCRLSPGQFIALVKRYLIGGQLTGTERSQASYGKKKLRLLLIRLGFKGEDI